MTLRSTALTAHVSSLTFNSEPLSSTAAVVCKKLLRPPAAPEVVLRCEENMLDVLSLRAGGLSDESTVHVMVLSDMPIAHYVDPTVSPVSGGGGGVAPFSSFLIVGPSDVTSAASSLVTAEEISPTSPPPWPSSPPDWSVKARVSDASARSGAAAYGFRIGYRGVDADAAPQNAAAAEDGAPSPPAPSSSSLSSSSPPSFFADVDAWAETLPVVSPYSTIGGFVHPSIGLLGPALPSPKGRGVFAVVPIEAWTMFELSPALLVPSVSMRITDGRRYRDTPSNNIMLDYLFPAGGGLVEEYSMLPMGWGMLYNHCNKEDTNMHWDIVRYGVKDATMSNRFTSFAIRYFTSKHVKAGEELCWDYGAGYWEPMPGLVTRSLKVD